MSHYLIIYDIRHPKRLTKVARVLLNYGIRVQKSVFEIDGGQQQLNEIRQRIKNIIEPEDYIVYFKICENDWQKRQKIGIGSHLGNEIKPFEIW